MLQQPGTPPRASLVPRSTHSFDSELERAYDCIESSRVERMRLWASTPLLLGDCPSMSSASSSSSSLAVSKTPPRPQSQSSRRGCNVELQVNNEDGYYTYEDDEDWIDERDAAIQELQERTVLLERRLQEQQERHEQEVCDLHTVVQQLQQQQQSQSQDVASTQRLQQVCAPEQLLGDPVVPLAHHSLRERTPIDAARDDRRCSGQVQVRIEEGTNQSDRAALHHSHEELRVQEYQDQIYKLEKLLREMSSQASSHELQVITDSTSVMLDMSLKLGEHVGENKFLRARVKELTEEIKNVRVVATETSKTERREKGEHGDGHGGGGKRSVDDEKEEQIRTQELEQPPLIRQRAKLTESSEDGQGENHKEREELMMQTATPATVVRQKENVENRRNKRRSASTKDLKDGIAQLMLVSDVPIDGRVELASKLRKLEQIALNLLPASMIQEVGRDGKRKKKNFHVARRRL